MPISFAKLMRSNVVTLKVEVGLPEKLKVMIEQNKVTGRFVQDIQDMAGQEDLRPMCAKMTEVLTGWDLVDEAGEKLPITEETLLDLPLSVLTTIMTDMVAELNPQKPNAGR